MNAKKRNMESMLVSVIIPVYNCACFLRQCVESLLTQTYRTLEIILVDDGSTDISPEICDEFAHKSDLIKVVHKENGGAAAARKAGLLQATGQYVLFVDADDWVEEKYVESLLALANNSHADAVVGVFQTYTKDRYKEHKHVLSQGPYNKRQCEETVFPVMLSAKPFFNFGVFPSMCGKLFKAELAKKNMDALDTGIIFGEDGCFTYSVLLDCQSIYITNQCGYIYRQNAESVTHKFNEALLLDGKKLKAFLEKLVEEKSWSVGTQIDEYMAYVCNYTVSKAIKAGLGKDRAGRKRLRSYIKSLFPKGFMTNPKLRKCSLKTKIRMWLIQKGFLFALQMLL